jgi:menaquinone-9 beta-reductase
MPGSSPLDDEVEVVVVGAGPAGSTCAGALAEMGHDVLVIDRDVFPRHKACGDALTRSAVEALRRVDLDDLVEEGQPIEGARFVVDHHRRHFRRYGESPARYARCISRYTLDEALLDVAIARGARFLHGRAERRVLGASDAFEFLEVTTPEGPRRIRAARVIGADGATSRIRRGSGATRRPNTPKALAARRYVHVAHELDPVFEVFLPLRFAGRAAAGFGWVFPLTGHLANVGVGFHRGGGLPDPPPLYSALDAFLEELRVRCGSRFGALEVIGKPLGSPLGVGFDEEACAAGLTLFAGDAARTTDPLSGEGITHALRGGELVATLAHEELCLGRRAPTGRAFARHFPRLNQDVGVLTRTWIREIADSRTSGERAVPFRSSLQRMVGLGDDDRGVESTDVWPVVAEHAPVVSEALLRFDAAASDTVRTRFPLATAVLQRALRRDAGPVAAATLLLCAHALGRTPRDSDVDLAFSVEAISLSGSLLANVADPPDSHVGRLGNTLAVLTAAFATSRSLRAAARRQVSAASALTTTAQCIAEANAMELDDLFVLDRPVGRRLMQLDATAGAATALSARLGASRAGAPAPSCDALAEYGRSLGIAFAISAEVTDASPDAAPTGRAAQDDLRRGAYSLPILIALDRSPRLHHLLTGAGSDDLADARAEIAATGALDAAALLSREYAARALEALDRCDVADDGPLRAMVQLAARHREARGGGASPAVTR